MTKLGRVDYKDCATLQLRVSFTNLFFFFFCKKREGEFLINTHNTIICRKHYNNFLGAGLLILLSLGIMSCFIQVGVLWFFR